MALYSFYWLNFATSISWNWKIILLASSSKPTIAKIQKTRCFLIILETIYYLLN